MAVVDNLFFEIEYKSFPSQIICISTNQKVRLGSFCLKRGDQKYFRR